jgi:protein gp37
MNKQNKDGIEWTDYTWNPITGCLKRCFYCYVPNKLHLNTEPDIHPERLPEPYKKKKPCKIFTGSRAEMFGNWVPKSWLESVFDVIKNCPHLTFQILTKFIERAFTFHFPNNVWLGITIDRYKTSVLEDQRKINLLLKTQNPGIKFISFEPLLGSIENLDLKGIDWIIIGVMTGKGDLIKRHPTKREWIEEIIEQANKYNIPVFLKNNLLDVYPDLPKRQEFPSKQEKLF